mgnify:CR=1 FL=1
MTWLPLRTQRRNEQYVNPAINVTIEDGHVVLAENENAMLDNPKQKHAFHGLYRSLVHNMVVGVSEGYKKELELVGVGYRALTREISLNWL